MDAHTGRVNDLRVTSDGRTLVSCGFDGKIRLWHRGEAGAASRWEPGPSQQREREVLGMALSRDGTRLVTAERNRSIGVWSLPDLRPVGVLDSETALWRPGLSPDGRWISVGLWDRSIQLWGGPGLDASLSDVSAIRRVATFIGHTQLVSAQVFNHTSDLMASTSADGQVKVWDVTGVPGGRAEATDESRRCLLTLAPYGGETYAATFLPPPLEHQLAIGYRDGSVRIWDLTYYDRHIAGQADYQHGLRVKRE